MFKLPVEVTQEMKERMVLAATEVNEILYSVCQTPAEAYAVLTCLLQAHGQVYGIAGVKLLKDETGEREH